MRGRLIEIHGSSPLASPELFVMHRKNMKLNFILLILLIMPPLNASGKDCTKKEEQIIESKAAYLKTWDEVFDSWEKFKHCDDGSIAEGFTESITKNLVKNWTEDGHLIRLIKNKPKFEKFILEHINEAVPYDRLSILGHMAEMRCQNSTLEFCMKILEKATKSILHNNGVEQTPKK